MSDSTRKNELINGNTKRARSWTKNIVWEAIGSGNTVRIGSETKYSVLHEYGGTISPYKKIQRAK